MQVRTVSTNISNPNVQNGEVEAGVLGFEGLLSSVFAHLWCVCTLNSWTYVCGSVSKQSLFIRYMDFLIIVNNAN